MKPAWPARAGRRRPAAVSGYSQQVPQAARAHPGSGAAPHAKGDGTAGLAGHTANQAVPRAFSLNSSITQRDAASRHGPVSTVDSMRRGWPEVAVGQGARRCHEQVAWAGLSARRSASKLTGTSRESLENGRSRPRHSLISSLIHLCTPASIGVYRRSLSSQRDLRGRSCTVIRTTEKRKVGGSTPPLTTRSHQRICCLACGIL